MSQRDKSGGNLAQLMEAEDARAPRMRLTREEEAFQKSTSSLSARYGIDVRGFRLHREAHDLDAVFETLDGIEGRISIFDRHTGRVIHGTADNIRQRIADSIHPDGEE